MPFKYGKSKSTGKTGWVQETNLNESGNLSGNASATENWLITTRENDQIYYKTAGNGDRYYIDKSDSTGATTTWNEEDAMTVAEWDAASPQLEENKISTEPPSKPIGGNSLPPRPAPLARSTTSGGSEIKTFSVDVGVNSVTGNWHPIGKPIEIVNIPPKNGNGSTNISEEIVNISTKNGNRPNNISNENLRRRKRATRRGRSRSRGRSRKVRR